MKAAVPASELEYVTSFLLTAVRDDVASVDHVDVSLVGASGGEVELTVRVPFAAESGGPEDAARLIERLEAMPDERR
jgi:hypothetical protein